MTKPWYKQEVTPKRVLLIGVPLVAIIVFAFIGFMPIKVRATIFKEAQFTVPFADILFNFDYGSLRIKNFSTSWVDKYANITYHLSVANVTGSLWHSEENLNGTVQHIILHVYIEDLHLTTDQESKRPSELAVVELHLESFDAYLEFWVEDGTITYEAYTTKTTTIWHELTGW